jgi:hypothetical protein
LKMNTKLQHLISRIPRLVARDSKAVLLATAILASLLLSILPANSEGQTLTAPAISVAGTHTSPLTVTMTAPAGTIYYTIDGSTPSPSSTQYTTPFNLSTSTELKAIAYVSGSTSGVTVTYVDVDTRILWLKASAGVSTNNGAPAPVNSWEDLSGSGYDASGSAGTYPTLKGNAINDLPAISFSGNLQKLQMTDSEFANFSSGATFFVVAKPAALTAGARIIDLADSSNNNNLVFQIAASGKGQFWVYEGSSGHYAESLNSLDQNQFQLLESVLVPGSPHSTATFYVNGIPGQPNSSEIVSIPNVSRSENFLGQASSSGNFYQGMIAEIIIYPAALTDSQRELIEGYLMQKYQLQSQVPAPPIISVQGGVLDGPIHVTIISEPGSTTRVTTDGSEPISTSPVYSGCPITVNYSQTLKAASFKSGLKSSVATASYTLDSRWAAPSPSDTTPPSINRELPAQTQ